MVALTRAALIKAAISSSISSPFLNISPQQSASDHLYTPAAAFVRKEINDIIQNQDPSLAGPILRLAFHDATVRSIASDPSVGGADGSVRYELDWSENRGLSKPLKVVNQVFESQNEKFAQTCFIKESVESSEKTSSCSPLSFADTLAISGAAAVEAAQGPKIEIKMGRTDVYGADSRLLDSPIESMGERSTIITSLPSAGLDSLGLRNYFKRLGLTEAELVALSGAHDLGRHVTLTGMPKECLRNLTRTCLEEAPVLAPFITKDPDTLSNRYFQTMLRWNDRDIQYGEAAFIPTDVALVVDDGLKKYVVAFAKDEQLFFRTFRNAYQKLVESTATTKSRY